MAYTNSPQFQTYKTETIKFDGTDFFRSADLTVNRDLQIVNMYYDRVSAENQTRQMRIVKRPGTALTAYNLSKVANTDSIRGSFYDIDTNTFYWVVKDKVYSVSPDSGTTVRTVKTLATTSGYVGFCSFLQQGPPIKRYICFTTGTELFVDEPATTTCTKVTDADLPSPHQPYPLYINGYLLVIKSNSGDIYNSDVDDPFTWSSAYVSAEISSDYAIRLFKAKNYMVCLGYNSVEYFWDKALDPPSSPFERNDSPVRSVGYVTGGCQIGDYIFFVGHDHAQNLAVYVINSFKVDKISNSVVERTLQSFGNTDNAKGKVTLDKDGFCISVDGHSFYVLTTPQTTWVYDVDEKFWYEWKNTSGTGLAVEAVWNMYNGACYVAFTNATYISRFSTALYRDNGSNYTCRYVTESADFGTGNWKVCNRVYLNCSMHNYTGTSNASVSWSDNDWADGGTTPRNINVFSSSPVLHRLGRFRGRSFRIEYADNYPFFIQGLQLDLNVMGQ
jgi:hypothetical protein